jgi:hypothetical protein
MRAGRPCESPQSRNVCAACSQSTQTVRYQLLQTRRASASGRGVTLRRSDRRLRRCACPFCTAAARCTLPGVLRSPRPANSALRRLFLLCCHQPCAQHPSAHGAQTLELQMLLMPRRASGTHSGIDRCPAKALVHHIARGADQDPRSQTAGNLANECTRIVAVVAMAAPVAAVSM